VLILSNIIFVDLLSGFQSENGFLEINEYDKAIIIGKMRAMDVITNNRFEKRSYLVVEILK
jgi:hypothetical protein